jgi:hypothetical protein
VTGLLLIKCDGVLINEEEREGRVEREEKSLVTLIRIYESYIRL